MARIVIVGSGHNALVCAAMLAGADHDVTILERRGMLGGATVTEEIIPGYRTSAASYSMSLFRPDVWHDLGLGDRVRLVRKEPAVSVPYPDGRSLVLRADAARTRASIGAIHPPDSDNYLRFSAFVEAAARALRPLMDALEPPTILEVERALGPDLFALCIAGSATDTAATFFASDELRGLVASQGIVGTAASVDDPGTAFILAYHFFGGEVIGETGAWSYVIGGTGAISAAIAAVARERGARVHLDAPIARIVHADGRVRGVELEDGSTIEADVVVSGADPLTTARLAELEPEQPWTSTSRTFKVNLALSALPRFGSLDDDACNGTLSFTWGLEHLRAAWRDDAGACSADPWMEVFVGSAVDPTLVDGDGHTLSAFCQYAGAAFSPAVAARTVIASLDRAAPGLADSVLGIQVLGPDVLAERFSLPGGNIFHGELRPPQVFSRRFPARTDISGLYRCGSGCHPGGAITGAPGRNGARAVLADLGT